MREPKFWGQENPTWQAHLLAPFAALYGLGEATHRFFCKPQIPSKPVICVGNLTIGGAGKTPTTRWLAQYLKTQGRNPAILSRGYGGSVKTKHPIRIDAAQIWQYRATQIGDEPLLLAQDAPTYISPDRHRSMRVAAQCGHDCAIKDDGFQNPNMRHCFNLIVIDKTTAIGNGRLLPAGALRQPLSIALQKTDALLILGEKTAPAHKSLDDLLEQASTYNIPLFYGQVKPDANIKPKRVFAYCGIAHPQKFYATLEQAGYEIVGTKEFSDHHNFTEKEAQMLCTLAAQYDVPLMTTEKDYMRLHNMPPKSARAKLRLVSEALPIQLHIENAEALHQLIEAALTGFHRPEPYTAY